MYEPWKLFYRTKYLAPMAISPVTVVIIKLNLSVPALSFIYSRLGASGKYGLRLLDGNSLSTVGDQLNWETRSLSEAATISSTGNARTHLANCLLEMSHS